MPTKINVIGVTVSASALIHQISINKGVYTEEGMQLVQPSKFFSVTIFRTHYVAVLACARANLGYIAIFSNAEKLRRLCSYYGSCMPSSPKEYMHP